MKTGQNNLIVAILHDKTQIIREKFASDRENVDRSSGYVNAESALTGDGAKVQFIDDFVQELKSIELNTRVLLEKRLFDIVDEKYNVENLKSLTGKLKFINIGDNLSLSIGKAAIEHNASDNLKVIYLQASKNCSL
jgi:hypothetical protein